MKIESLHQLFLESSGISTDTRKISENTLFFALKGDNFNGNKFAEDALKKGASYVVIDEKKYKISSQTILVDNALETLQKLANYHRNYLKIPIISLTGSNGKTTTKELINSVLSEKYNTAATVGNLNNHIGVPLTLLSMNKNTEMGIVEMGANHLKEIEFLCEIAEPDYGYITNFGKAHLEGFGSKEGVVQGKSELYNYLLAHNKHVFLNADDPIQEEKLSTYIKKFGYSQTNSKYSKIEFIEANPFVSLKTDNTAINSKLIGAYNFTNIAVAVLIGKYFNVDIDDIKDALEAYMPNNNRSQIIEKATNRLILDAYNANPSSMKAALTNLNGLKDTNKIAILGDMFELGNDAEIEHQAIADYASDLNINSVYLIGENFNKISTESKTVKLFKSFEAFKEALKDISITNSTLLIKGSRGMALERTLDFL